MTAMPQDALARIPGWQHADWDLLEGGQTNRTWLLIAGNRKAVLKVDTAPRVAPFNGRLLEQDIQSRAAEADLASRVLFSDETSYLTEYIEGDVWTAADLEKEENLIALARVLRRLHALPLSGRRFDIVGAAHRYRDCIDSGKSAVALDYVDVIEKYHAPPVLCCCHNDLVAANIIAIAITDLPDLRLLDWEYACDNDPLFDLATVVAHHNLSASLATCLLDAYFEGDGERWREKFEQQVILYGALHWLWSASGASATSGFEAREV